MKFVKFKKTVVLACVPLFALPATAGPTASANAAQVNAAPFGLELGKATLADVKNMVPSAQGAGINNYSHGPQLNSDGSGIGMDEIKCANFIFDQSNTLSAVVLSFPKDPTGMMKLFSGKYKLVYNKVDSFMNYGNARYEKGNTFIDIGAPHLSFDMTVTYATKPLMAAFMKSQNDKIIRKEDGKKQAL